MEDKRSIIKYTSIWAGFGEKTDWLQNLAKTSQARIFVGRRKLMVIAQRLPVAEAQLLILDYARRHPLAPCNLVRILGD